MVLATDGLWDYLDPDTVVRLVFDHTLGMQTLTSSFEGTALTQVLKFYSFLILAFSLLEFVRIFPDRCFPSRLNKS